jgi:hypothetical protein
MANIIKVSEEDRNMVQRADIECSARANLISFMISNNMDISSENFQRYQTEYQEKFLAFDEAKSLIEKKYLKGVNASTWSLDYKTCELSYT